MTAMFRLFATSASLVTIFACLAFNLNPEPSALRYVTYEQMIVDVTYTCIVTCNDWANCTAVAVWPEEGAGGGAAGGKKCILILVVPGYSQLYGNGTEIGDSASAEVLMKQGGPIAPNVLDCPAGFTNAFNRWCYHVSPEAYTFDGGRTYCEGLANGNGKMVTFDGLQKFDNAYSPVPGSNNTWMGARKLTPEGAFLQIYDNSPMLTIGWNKGFPNATLGDCVYVVQYRLPWFENDQCSAIRHAYCETDMAYVVR